MSIIDDINADGRKGLIASWRYLAYLDEERRYLLHELTPGWEKIGFMVPCDLQVSGLNPIFPDEKGDPISRAPEVLRFLGIDPYREDEWAECIGVDISRIPILRPNEKKRWG